MDMLLYLLTLLCEVTEFVKLILIARQLHFYLVKLLLQLHFTSREVSSIHPYLVIQIDLHRLLPLYYLVPSATQTVNRFNQSSVSDGVMQGWKVVLLTVEE